MWLYVHPDPARLQQLNDLKPVPLEPIFTAQLNLLSHRGQSMGVSGDPGGMGCWQPLGGDHQDLPSTPHTPEPLGTWGGGQSWYECPYFLAVETDLVKLW